MKPRHLISLCFVLALLAAKGPTHKATKNLQRILQQLDDARAQLRAAKKNERASTRILSELDALRFKTARSLRKLDQQLKAQQQKVGQLKGRVQVDQKEVHKIQQRLRSRLRSLSMLGRLGPWRILLAAKSLDQLALRRVLIKRIAVHDAILLRSLQRGRLRLSDDQQALLDAFDTLRQQRDDSKAALAALQQSRAERAAAIQKFGAQRGSLELQIEALRQSEKKLRQLIWRSSPHKIVKKGLAKLRGQLPWPVLGRVEPSQGGWNLRAARGLPVSAIAAGRIVHAGFLRAYGGLVIVDHGHGFHSLYAHLDSISVSTGQTIGAGARLGSLGDSESMDGVKLYFELRRNGRPVTLKHWLSRQARLPAQK